MDAEHCVVVEERHRTHIRAVDDPYFYSKSDEHAWQHIDLAEVEIRLNGRRERVLQKYGVEPHVDGHHNETAYSVETKTSPMMYVVTSNDKKTRRRISSIAINTATVPGT